MTKRTLMTCGLLLLAGCSSGAAPSAETTDRTQTVATEMQVAVSPADRQSLVRQVEFTGSLLPRKRTQIFAEVEGVVKTIPQIGTKFDVVVNGKRYVEQLSLGLGQHVRQGDVLLKIDVTDLENEVLVNQAKLDKAQADLDKLKAWDRAEEVVRLSAMVDEASARYEQAQQDLRRETSLHQRRANTPADVENASLKVATSKATYKAAQAQLEMAKAGPTEAELAVQQAMVAEARAELIKSQAEVKKATVLAPYDGVITTINVEVGQRVAPAGDPLIEIMDLRFVVAELGIPEKYIGQIHIRDTAEVYASGSIKPVPAMVVAINDLVDPTTRRYTVRLALDNAHRQFKAGQFVRVQLTLGDQGIERLVIPQKSIVYVQGEPTVFVFNDGIAKQKPIKMGVASDELVEVLDGLTEGEAVIVDDPTLVTDGAKVQLKVEN